MNKAGTARMKNQRNCYCRLWETHPSELETRGIPRGYCGICSACGRPGHLRHAPGCHPYTDAWCDPCFRYAAARNYAQCLSMLAAPVALALAFWRAAGIAAIVFAVTTFLLKHNLPRSRTHTR